MEQKVKHKLYMGYQGFMLPVPRVLSEKGAQRGQKGARANADSLTDLERRVHHFTVLKMVNASEPITSEMIADEMKLPLDQVSAAVDKLEKLKTFIYRSDGKGIDWAYPLSLDNTGFRMTSSSGEKFFAAWAADAFASPYVLGQLNQRQFNFTINAKCANSDRDIEIVLNSDLEISHVTKNADPMFCLPIVPIANTKQTSIVDIFWRRSLLFWSEEDVREYKKRERDLRVYMNLSQRSLNGIKRMQASIFGFDE